MALEKVLNSITSSKLYNNAGKGFNKLCSKIGPSIENAVEKHPNLDKFIKAYEPTGANNAFLGLTTLMVGTVIIPRVLTAKKRNPDNKEATFDEIKEILFRDVQTVLIILFSLKAMNSLVAAKVSKIKGLPLTNKPYEKFFQTTEKGFKGIKDKASELIHHPFEKIKTAGKNIINTLHPTGGVIALTNEECVSKYSNFSNLEQVDKLFDEINSNGGKPEKVFENILDKIIEKQKAVIENLKNENDAISGIAKFDDSKIKQAEKNLEKLKLFKEGGIEGFKEFLNNRPINEDDIRVKELIKFFQNDKNALVSEALGLNAVLRTIALGIEMTYLGFGLPALNERRLEKKYLKNGGKNAPGQTQNSDTSNQLLNKNIKAQEIKLFHNFLK